MPRLPHTRQLEHLNHMHCILLSIKLIHIKKKLIYLRLFDPIPILSPAITLRNKFRLREPSFPFITKKNFFLDDVVCG